MSKFFDPPQAKPLLPKEKIDSVYKSMRFKVFMGSFLGYAAYYLVRKNLSLAAPDMIAEGLVDKRGKRKPESEMSELEKLRAENRMLAARNKRLETENAVLKKLEEIERRWR